MDADSFGNLASAKAKRDKRIKSPRDWPKCMNCTVRTVKKASAKYCIDCTPVRLTRAEKKEFGR